MDDDSGIDLRGGDCIGKVRKGAAVFFFPKRLDCEGCEETGLQAQRHCPKIDRSEWLLPEIERWELFDEKQLECPGLYALEEEVQEAIELWRWSEKGIFPNAGGLNDQENYDLSLISIVEGVRNFYSQTGEE